MVGNTKCGRGLFFSLVGFAFVTSFGAITTSCSKKSDMQAATGDVSVQIALQTSSQDYKLKVVTLSGIQKLDEVRGDFAKFFFSPGSNNSELTGNAPHAYFLRTSAFFVPSDIMSMQMATIYYHMQNMAGFDKLIGAEGVNRWPRSVGVETLTSSSDDSLRRNNAFYSGQTDAMMFVPFDRSDLPISLNAGIIAHEHFHSLFYKIVMIPLSKTQQSLNLPASIHSEELTTVTQQIIKMMPAALTDVKKAELFNETYLRGVNEGFADFWGWLYTDDVEFMHWSLPEHQARRTLEMAAQQEGVFKSAAQIKDKVERSQFSSDQTGELIGYAYEIGTPYARFLKQFTGLVATSLKLDSGAAKKLMAQILLKYMKELVREGEALGSGKTIDPKGLFNFIVAQAKLKDSEVGLDVNACQFLLKYVNAGEVDKVMQCQGDGSNVLVVEKP